MGDAQPSSGRREWQRVSSRGRCPICDHANWCQVLRDGTAAMCMRVASPIERQAVDGNTFWIHKLDAGTTVWQPSEQSTGYSTTERADDETLDEVYRAMISMLTLSAGHSADLIARGLSESQIKSLLFRTMPREGRAEIASRIVERFGEFVAASVPGFYFKKTRWSLGGAHGLIIPGFNVYGQITTIRIRADTGTRYTYLSSSSHDGPSAKQAVYVPDIQTGADELGLRPVQGLLLRVTEGEIKAAIATARTAVTTVAVPGAGNHSTVPEVLKALGATRVLIAYDQDEDENTRRIVESARAKLAAACARVVGPSNVGIETWPISAGKGIDDVLVSGNAGLITVSWVAPPPVPPAPPRAYKKVRLPVTGPVPVPVDQASNALVEALDRAEEGLSVLLCPPGVGKTHAAEIVATRRAKTPYRSENAAGLRAPLHSKTTISVDTNDLAKQVTKNLRSAGVDVRRLFGPLSAKGPDGNPLCQYHDVGSAMAKGGQSVRMALCEGRSSDGGVHYCQYYQECTARLGSDGPEHARVTVGVHDLLDSLAGEAGSTGLLVIDEPPGLLETKAWTASNIEHAIVDLNEFAPRYASCMRPAVTALLSWVRQAEALQQEFPPSDFFSVLSTLETKDSQEAVSISGSDSLPEWVKAARTEKNKNMPPPLKWNSIAKAKRDLAYAHSVGRASELLKAIESVILHDDSHAVRIELRNETYTLVLTSPKYTLLRAIKREGATAILDANADLNVPLYAKAVGYDLSRRTYRFNVADGAPIERVLIRCKSANKTQWFERSKPRWDAGIIHALGTVIDWLKEDPSTAKVGFIAPKAVADAIKAFQLGTADPVTTRAIGEALAGWDGPPWSVGHYGAIRGKDDWKECDAIVTFMDPWHPKSDAMNEAAFLQASDIEGRYSALCKAELEQAQGRLRTIHRTRPGRALHLGNVVPGGMAWTSFEERPVPMGRPKERGRATAEQVIKARRDVLKTTQQKFAERVGVGKVFVSQIETGQRQATAEISEEVFKILGLTTASDNTAGNAELTRMSIQSSLSMDICFTEIGNAELADELPVSLSPEDERPSNDDLNWELTEDSDPQPRSARISWLPAPMPPARETVPPWPADDLGDLMDIDAG